MARARDARTETSRPLPAHPAHRSPSLGHALPSHTSPGQPSPDRPSLARRLGWFVALYAGGVAAVSLVAAVVRFWIG